MNMKKFLLPILCLAAAFGLQAQSIPNDSEWFSGTAQYTATRLANGNIQMYMMNEGEEIEFVLKPVSGKSGQYTYVDWAEEKHSVKLIQRDGITVLADYNAANHLEMVCVKTTERFDRNLLSRFFTVLSGKYSYSKPGGGTGHIVIGKDSFSVDGVASSFEVPTLNDYPMDILRIQDGPWKGLWHFVMTASGLNAYRTEIDEYGMSEDVDEKPVVLVWDDPTRGRWDFLSQDFVCLLPYTRQTLRIMRNAIMAKHGYVFKSEELKLLFEFEPWYSPAPDNASVKLSLIEEMNVALIQGEEAKSDDERYVREEEPGLKRYLMYDEDN